MIPRIFFWIAAALVVGGALFTVTRRNAVSAVMSLVATFFGLAVIYVFLSAHLLAVLQVLVYAGAIMTLFVFVVMVLSREEIDLLARRGFLSRIFGIAIGTAGMAWIGSFLWNWQPSSPAPAEVPAEWGGVADVGEVLFKDYLFPFEAISLVLLVAVIAAVVLARIPRRAQHGAGEPAAEPTGEGADAAAHATGTEGGH